ncbi:HAMP domain-containing histidine kinase [Cohnella ginsengisoli]|uniref:histidine kinase n=1 Tax=Cohnella ginsengisoli TaxID=425004 RepID=A0A9X4KE61_9BACL|nr:HAMP domain-containing sensor histidine kinase [Cohnella ginsengisoli]MDG0790361.1 HAMP domain-containing histidine kinase [Cohnella ginsengisoli]
MSIRLRLTLWYSGLLAIVLIGFSVIMYVVVSQNTMGVIKTRLANEADKIRVTVSPEDLDLTPRASSPFDVIIAVQIVNYTQSFDGVVNTKSSNLIASNITFPFPSAKQALDGKYRAVTLSGTPFLIYEKRLELGGQLLGLLQVGAYTGKEIDYLSQMKVIIGAAGLASLVLAFVIGLFLARKALRPIEKVTEAAERVQSGSDLKLRIPGESQDEIGRLTRTLNHMLERVEKAYNVLEESNAAQRRFVSDASHELRTPLTTIRGNVDLLEKVWAETASGDAAAERGSELAKPRLSLAEREELSREALHDISDEARRMSRLVNDLLSLARADAGYVVDKEPIDLLPLVEEAARRAGFLPRKAEWIVGPLDALAGVRVVGNRDYLMQLLFIFIENGFKYTPAGEVRLEVYRQDDRIGLSIADTGIGIAKSDMPRIFDRFYRADESRGQTAGTGLGLSIAKWIADMHRATLEVQSHPEGGSRFTVWLPVDFSERQDYAIIEASVRPAVPDAEQS